MLSRNSWLLLSVLLLGACSAPMRMDGSSIREQYGRLVVDGVAFEHSREVALNGRLDDVSAATWLRLFTHTGNIDIAGGPSDTYEFLVTVESELPDDGVVELIDGELFVTSSSGAGVAINGVQARLPQGVSLDLISGSGKVLLNGFSGEAQIDIHAPVGAVRISETRCASLQVLGGTGFVKWEQTVVDEANVQLGTGAFQVVDSELGELRARTGTGEMQLSGTRVREGNFSSATGNLALLGSQVSNLIRSLGAGRLIEASGRDS